MTAMRETKKWRYILTIPATFVIGFVPSLAFLPLMEIEMQPISRFVLMTVIQIGLAFLLVYLYNHYILHQQFTDIWVRKPGPQWRWIVLTVLMMALTMGSTILLTEGTLHLDDLTTANLINEIAFHLLIPGIAAGMMEELVLRGFLFSSLEQVWSRRTAVVVSVLVFVVMHWGGAIELNDPVSTLWVFVVILLSGTLLTLIMLETGSIWTGVIVHTLLNQYSWIRVMPEGSEPSGQEIWIYDIAASQRWMTGSLDANNMQAGVPAIIGYILLIVLGLYMIGRKK